MILVHVQGQSKRGQVKVENWHTSQLMIPGSYWCGWYGAKNGQTLVALVALPHCGSVASVLLEALDACFVSRTGPFHSFAVTIKWMISSKEAA